jgi:Mn2+/Fe2+ NRAMP family transporter
MAFEIEQPIDAGPSPVVEPTKPRLLGVLGPGLITGASDDDPSGIATYSQAGAQFGYALTWTMLFTYPLMTAVQIVSARMGRHHGPRHRRQPSNFIALSIMVTAVATLHATT